MLAPSGEHLVHLLAWALQSKMTIKQILGMPFYHPVLEEDVRTAFPQNKPSLPYVAARSPML
jgi:dihydrolipoamide dehydrogenase